MNGLIERFALRCHQANVARWKFYQLPRDEVSRCLALAEMANGVQRAHKRKCKEKLECGWNEKLVTPWPRDLNQYIQVPVHMLVAVGCVDEAERTWLADVRAMTLETVMKNRRSAGW